MKSLHGPTAYHSSKTVIFKLFLLSQILMLKHNKDKPFWLKGTMGVEGMNNE